MKDQRPNRPSLFRPGPGPGNVVLNFRDAADEEFGVYARAFHRSGRELADRMLSAAGYSDLDACPIIFLYRHALELYLKAVIRIGMRYSTTQGMEFGVGDRPLTQHSLTKLLPGVRQTLTTAGWAWDMDIDGLRTLAEFEASLREMDEVDRGSFAFRYPVDKDGLGSVPHHFTIDVPTFCRRMDTLLDALEAAVTGLEVELDSHPGHARSAPCDAGRT